MGQQIVQRFNFAVNIAHHIDGALWNWADQFGIHG
jgi:hypothetical protein